MFIGFQRVAKECRFCGSFIAKDLDYKGLDWFLCGIPGFDTAKSLRCHEHRQRQLDELFILVDGVQGAAHVVGNVSRAARLDPIGKLQDGGFQGELVFVDLEQ